MELIVLGSGTSVPHPKRSSSAFWIETGSGTLLLDCSASAIHRMAQEGCDWANLDAVWLSHFHLDHCGGIGPFLFGTKYAPETQGRTKPLRIFGPSGSKALLQRFTSANDYRLLSQPFSLEVIEVAPGASFDIFAGLTASTFSTPHTPESCAIRLDKADGRSLVFSSDTGYSSELGRFARDVDVLLIECSFVKDKPVEIHLNVADVAQIAGLSKPGKIVLTHFYPEWDRVNFHDSVAEISKYGEVIEATDGLRLTISGKSETEKEKAKNR